MRIWRRGKFRNHGIDYLVSSDEIPSMTWEEDEGSVRLTRTARSRNGSTYRYTVKLTGEELAQIVETALVGAAHNDRNRKAEGRAKATYLRSMLCDEDS